MPDPIPFKPTEPVKPATGGFVTSNAPAMVSGDGPLTPKGPVGPKGPALEAPEFISWLVRNEAVTRAGRTVTETTSVHDLIKDGNDILFCKAVIHTKDQKVDDLLKQMDEINSRSDLGPVRA